MKSLKESLFDDDLAQKDLLGGDGFKKFLSNPEVLGLIFQYWDSGEDNDELYFTGDWETYKPYVDIIIKEMDKINKRNLTWLYYAPWMVEPSDTDIFEADFNTAIGGVKDLAKRKGTISDGLYMYKRKGNIIPDGQLKNFIENYKQSNWSLDWDGYILWTDLDTIIVFGFPKGMNKNILKAFGII
jgi:hypothetical protein